MLCRIGGGMGGSIYTLTVHLVPCPGVAVRDGGDGAVMCRAV